MRLDRESLYEGASYAAWGYLFLYLDISFENVSILPRFVGWLLFLSAIKRLSSQRRDLALLRPLGILLAAWYGADWLLSWAGATLDGRSPALDLIVSAASLYFQFQFLTDCAALAERYQGSGDELDRRLLRWRTVQTLLITGLALLRYPVEFFGSGGWAGTAAAAGVLIVGCLAALRLMAALFALRRLFREEPETPG